MSYSLVVDFEATCSSDSVDFPRIEMEIIEIGAVILDENNEERGRYQAFIRPVKNPILTDFCKKLTTIKQSDVDSADTFVNAMIAFQKWITDTCGRNDYVFLSWGNFDKNILKRQCVEENLRDVKMINNHINAKEEFGKQNKIKPCGVSSALKYKKMDFVGTHHRALDDAINIAELIKTLSL